MQSRKSLSTLVLLAGVFAAGAASAVQTVPADGSWAGYSPRLSPDRSRYDLVDKSGKTLCSIHGEPWQVDLSSVVVTNAGDRLAIDPSAALKTGKINKLVMTGAALDRVPLNGIDCTMKSDVEGPQGSVCTMYFEGQKADGQHYYSYQNLPQRGARHTFAMVKWVEKGLKELHVRFDVEKVGGSGPILLGAFKVGSISELPIAPPKKYVKPELVFHVPFDGDAMATVGGARRPLNEARLEYAEGKRGKAVRFGSKLDSRLEYAIRGNMDPDRGTVAMWVKREWDFSAPKIPWQDMFSFVHPANRTGSGALWFWWYDGQLRGDVSDPGDHYRTWFPSLDGRWMHVAFSWDEDGAVLYVNGKRCGGIDDGSSPMVEALRQVERGVIDRSQFTSFFVGNREGGHVFDGLMDDFRIYSAPLSDAQVKALWSELADPADADPKPDYRAMFKDWKGSPFVLDPIAEGGQPGAKTLVEELRFDALPGPDRFKSSGAASIRQLGDVKYLDAGGKEGDRFVVRFRLDAAHPLYCFEIDYPDDVKRTADIIIQPSRGYDYAMQVGYAAGGDYPSSGKVRTHRCVYWTHGDDVGVVFMTARSGENAAVSAIRVYRLDNDGLPAARVNEPAATDGWQRTFALYFEDPSVGYDYGLADAVTPTPEGMGKLVDRVIAGMKYTGQNMLAYPGAWYHGLIGEDYNPRTHAPDFLSAYYEKFDRAGLGLMPTLNVNNMAVEPGLVTRASMSDGTLHPSPIAIHDTGRPNWGHWHDTPPNFNFSHPDVMRNIIKIVDTLVEQGKDHPSFKGVCLHMTKHCMLWFGDLASGYNDYTVDAFAKDKGLTIPVDRADPMRGEAYAKWIRENCLEDWIQWRCDLVTRFYARLAERLRRARPDLKLWMNSFAPADYNHPDFARPDYMRLSNRACGLDAEALNRAIPNLILCQSMVPADYRKLNAGDYRRPGAREVQRTLELRKGFYDLIAEAAFPWVNQHDRYWESAIGGNGQLSTPWFSEMGWRVTTINPSGRSALRHFVAPFRHTDVLGLSKGGFLIGTYGMEDVLVPFIQAFRALPAVRMTDVPNGPDGDVRFRHAKVGGRDYYYLVNAGDAEQTVSVEFPAGLRNLVTGEPVTSGKVTLQPYEFRSYGP